MTSAPNPPIIKAMIAVSFVLIPFAAHFTRDYYLTIHNSSLTQDDVLLFTGMLFGLLAMLGLARILACGFIKSRTSRTIAVVLFLTTLYALVESAIYITQGFRAAFFNILAIPGLLTNGILLALFSPGAKVFGPAEIRQTFVLLTLFLLFYHALAVTSVLAIRRSIEPLGVSEILTLIAVLFQFPIYFIMYFLGHSAMYAT